MTKYYDVTLTNRRRNRKISFLADSFSVNEERILKIKSKQYGDITVQILGNEELTVKELELRDEVDDLVDYLKEREENGDSNSGNS